MAYDNETAEAVNEVLALAGVIDDRDWYDLMEDAIGDGDIAEYL